MTRRQRRRDHGFSLIELLVVLTLMALLVVLHPAVGGTFLSGLTLEGTARDLVSDLRRARGMAVIENREAWISFDVDRRHYEGEGIAVEMSAVPNLSMTITAAASERQSPALAGIRFFPDGSSSGGRVSLDDGGHIYEITVDWFDGRISLEKDPAE